MNKATFDAMLAQYAVQEASGEGAVSWDKGARCVIPEVLIGGRVEQVTYEGWNLIPFPFEFTSGFAFGGITWTYDTDNIIHVNGTGGAYKEHPIVSGLTLPPGEYAIYTEQTHTRTRVYLNKNGSLFISLSGADDGGKHRFFTVEAGDIVDVTVCALSTNIYSDDTILVQITQGTETHPFEPYTGGIPAPNPNYPIKPEFSEGTAVQCGDTVAVAPELLAIPGTDIRDEWNPQTGKGVRRCAVIASYAGETIDTPYISSTGELSEGAYVVYGIPATPFQTDAQPLIQPKGTGHIMQVGGTLDAVPISAKYVTHS